MSKKLTNKLLMKTYYNLKLIEEIKQNTYEGILADPLGSVEQKALALQDELELQRLINILREMVEDAYYEALSEEKTMTDYLKEDPYYKLVEIIHKQNETQKKTPRKKIDKKLMN
jgi:hypothetical protein